MARSLQLDIQESREELEHRLKAQTTGTGKERLQMLYWLKLGKLSKRQQLAQLLHRSESTITRWVAQYRGGGLPALLEVKQAPGKPAKVPPEAVAQLRQRLQQPPGLKSYGEVQQWLQQTCGVNAAYKTVHKLVRYQLQAKLKVPRPRSHKQNPVALEQFKKTLPLL